MDKEQLIRYWEKSGLLKNKNLMKAFRKIKREDFVLPEYKNRAYEDTAIPLKHGSTISQPSTIMIMLEALKLKKGLKVLEIGTGSGYTAALIAEITKKTVYSMEIVPELIKTAENNFKKEKIKNIKLFCRDGSKGLKEYSSYDRILVNAASKDVSKELIKQLKTNGIMIAPIGGKYSQKMIKFTKEKKGIREEYLGEFIFVPMQNR